MRTTLACMTHCLVIVLMGCSPDRLEPNDRPEDATFIQVGTEVGLAAPRGDQDWFEFQIPEGNIARVGIEYPTFSSRSVPKLEAYDAQAEPLGIYSWPDSPRYRTGTPEEFLSLLALAGPRSCYFRVADTSAYDFSLELIPYADGPNCADQYGMAECEGCVAGYTALHQFPAPDPDDVFVGAGYTFAAHAKYAWARREAIMYIRTAIHEVQQAFPGTNAVDLIDMSQRDALTPGADVGLLRHPEGSHSQGGNIDIAYYQTVQDSRARTVCDDAGGSHNGQYCDESAVDTHIVDLERTSYFIAKLSALPNADQPRLRVVGVDRVIGPLIDQALLDLKNAERITEAEYENAYYRVAYGDGWPFHHHHMHVSFQWWDDGKDAYVDQDEGCGFRMPGDRE